MRDALKSGANAGIDGVCDAFDWLASLLPASSSTVDSMDTRCKGIEARIGRLESQLSIIVARLDDIAPVRAKKAA